MAASSAVRHLDSQPEWFQSWFDSAHYQRLYAHRDEAEATALVDRLIDRLRPAAGARVLDLGCGTGRHSRRLSSQGLNVLGLDLSAESIRQACATSHEHLRFRRHDMREPFGTGVFDSVFNLFTSFGYFTDPAEHLQVIQNIARSLKAGGTLVLDYLNVQYALSHLVAEEVIERDDVRYRISRWSDADHIYKRITIDDAHGDEDVAPVEHVERVARLGLADFRFMFALCGLTLVDVFGNYRLDPFDEQSSARLLLVASRTAAPNDRLLLRQLLPNAAQSFRRHAEVRREHGLRNALDDRRVHAQELEITLPGGLGKGAGDAVILRRCMPL